MERIELAWWMWMWIGALIGYGLCLVIWRRSLSHTNRLLHRTRRDLKDLDHMKQATKKHPVPGCTYPDCTCPPEDRCIHLQPDDKRSDTPEDKRRSRSE